jgi:hypothetical protein
MRPLRGSLPLIATCLLAASPAWATSIFVEGVIVSVNEKGGGYTLKGYDHYNHKKYGDKIGEIPVRIAAGGIFVLDNRIVTRQIALVPGRWAYAIGSSAGAGMTIVLSEPASRVHGQIVSADGSRLKLKIPQGLDSYEQEIELAGSALFRNGGKEAQRGEVLVAGKAVRVAPARPQTVLAFTPACVVTEIPKGFSCAAWGILKDPAGAKLAVFKGATAEEYVPEVKSLRPVHDIAGDVCHGPMLKPALAPGMPAVALGWQKRGPAKVDWYLVTQWPDKERTEGIVKSFDAGKLLLDVLTVDGVKETAVLLDAGATIRLDNKDTAPGEALKAGHYVSVYAARPQVIESVQWPESGKK